MEKNKGDRANCSAYTRAAYVYHAYIVSHVNVENKNLAQSCNNRKITDGVPKQRFLQRLCLLLLINHSPWRKLKEAFAQDDLVIRCALFSAHWGYFRTHLQSWMQCWTAVFLQSTAVWISCDFSVWYWCLDNSVSILYDRFDQATSKLRQADDKFLWSNTICLLTCSTAPPSAFSYNWLLVCVLRIFPILPYFPFLRLLPEKQHVVKFE